MKKVLVAVAALVILAVLLLPNVLVDRATPQEMTVSSMVETSVRIELYFEAHKKLPQQVSELPVREGYMNSTVDGWNRPLLFEASENEIVLRSYGADGVTGGGGKNADYERKITRDALIGMLWQVERKIDLGKETITDKWPL